MNKMHEALDNLLQELHEMVEESKKRIEYKNTKPYCCPDMKTAVLKNTIVLDYLPEDTFFLLGKEQFEGFERTNCLGDYPKFSRQKYEISFCPFCGQHL